MACEGNGSRYDVAREILEILGRSDEIELVEVGSEFFSAEYPSVRPRSEIMRNLHLELQGLNTMRPWQVALAEYLHTQFGELVHDLARPVIDLTETGEFDAVLQEEPAR
jgi:dTDP-4-dehydrorhamnose reductase